MRKYLFFTCLMVFHLKLIAQITISGDVIDNETLEPIPGATITEKGTTNGTMTNQNGKFNLTVKDKSAVVVISSIGYLKLEKVVGNQTKFKFNLVANASDLEDVVVVGYQKVHERDVTGAISSISAKDIENIPVISVSQLLATQSTGLQSINLSGAPGARNSLIIRGNTSISGELDANSAFSNPLYVIDGVQTSLEDLAGYNVSNQDFLASLNPNDIQSIDILKDASASAIYGSRGANGVIIITTKSGQALDKPEFTFGSSIGYIPKPDLVPMLVGSAERNRKMDMINTWWQRESLMNSQTPMVLSDSLNPAFNNNFNFQGLFYEPGLQQKYNFSMRGGSEETNYRVSLGYDDSRAVVINTGFKRYTLAANLNNNVGKNFKNQLRANMFITDNLTGQGNPSWEGYNLNSNLPLNPASLNSSLFYVTPDKIKSLSGELTEKRNTDQTFSTTFTNFAQLHIIPSLSINSILTFVYSSNKKDFYEPSSIRPERDGLASYQLYNRKNLSSDLYLSYIKNIGESNITAMLGNKIDYNKYDDMGIRAVGFGSDAIQVINSRYTQDQISGFTNLSSNALLSYFGSFSYKFKDRYIISGNYSIDGSSRFGKDVRWAHFPSIAAGWIFSDEPFLKQYIGGIVNYAKLRASYGINGKQFTENFLRFGSYNLGYGGNPYWANQMNVSSYGGVTGVVPNYDAIGNSGLSWESAKQWDIGLELEMFKSRVIWTFGAYNKQTDKLFFDVYFPAYSGYNKAKVNVAGILNYGWESMLKYHVFPRNNNLRLELSFGLSQNKGFVSKLPNGNRDYLGSDYGYVVGRPINLYKAFINDYIIDDVSQLPVNPYTGIPLAGKSTWAQIRPGFPIWRDLNGDYILNEDHDYRLSLDYSPVPDLLGNFNINLQYLGWYLQAYSQFSFGADIKNTVLQAYMDAYDRGGTAWATRGLADLSVYSFWEKPGDGAAGVRFPAIYPSGAGLGSFYGFRDSQTLWIESGDYWKITNISLGYTFNNHKTLSKIGLNRLRIFGSILNPLQWQRSKAVVDASLVDAKGHIMGNGYPQSKTFSLGFDAKF